MDLKKLAAPFSGNDIEWRIGRCGKTNDGTIWATCLAYVQARAIMDRFDEVCGPENWRVEYWFPKEKATIAKIYIKTGEEWICKEDGAEETAIESFKGGLSSALKRAGSVWGVGRYLYGLEEGFAEITQDRNDRYGKLPQESGGNVFRWIEPRLPDWALPEKERSDFKK